MRNHELRRINISRNDAVTQITQLVGDIEGFLFFQMHSACCNYGNRALCQFTFKGCEWNTLSRYCHKIRIRYQSWKLVTDAPRVRSPNVTQGPGHGNRGQQETKMPDEVIASIPFIWHPYLGYNFRRTSNKSSLSG